MLASSITDPEELASGRSLEFLSYGKVPEKEPFGNGAEAKRRAKGTQIGYRGEDAKTSERLLNFKSFVFNTLT